MAIVAEVYSDDELERLGLKNYIAPVIEPVLPGDDKVITASPLSHHYRAECTYEFVDPTVLHMVALAMHGHDGKPCRNSYGWCFTHMSKAVPGG